MKPTILLTHTMATVHSAHCSTDPALSHHRATTEQSRVLDCGSFRNPMKTILFVLTLLIGCVSGMEQVIRPMVGPAFGKVCVVDLEFVEKENSYIEQNIIKERWMAKVSAVDGQKLERPVVIEYRLAAGSVVMKGLKYRFKAYEDMYQLGSPRGWDETVAQIDYQIRNLLVLKPIAPINQK